ncbi:MAG: hypothetical protein RMH84_01800 [Sulfolobales archaeon]|nr:hypothetical protein [Sulfolobales archaeon]MCX8208659.1 hypothetical protein [Sulfolobales archaeon]MDW8010317.1 hypothetical protein [Sulfolobales archaeon]
MGSALAVQLCFLFLLVLPISATPAAASSSLEKHTPDFQLRLSNYGDVWTKQEIAALTEILDSVKKYGLASIEKSAVRSEDVLMRLISKLRHVDEKLSLVLEVVFGISRGIPKDLIAKVEAVAPPSRNVSDLVRVLNELYMSGELSSVEYLVLMGYVVNEFRAEYVEDSKTTENVRRAIEEAASMFSRTQLKPLPEPSLLDVRGARALFVKIYEAPGLVVVSAVVAVLLPLAVFFVHILNSRSRYPAFVRRALRTIDLAVSNLRFPEDAISAYWTAVDILSKVAAIEPWETHREYLARLEKELSNRRVLYAFKTLAEEYEKVRFASLPSSLSKKSLVDILLSIYREL